MRTDRIMPFLASSGWCFLLLTVALGAQDRETQQEGARAEEMEVPPVVFEYDSPPQREINALIPEPEPLNVPEIELILPEPEKMEISSLQVPISPPAEPLEEEATESSFFSEGRIGVGGNNHLLGDISLYKRGESPHFSFGFSHEGTDGYGEKPSGTGYFHRVEQLTGSFRGEGDNGSLDVNGEYREQEKGLQDFSEASSVIHRFVSADSTAVYGITEKLRTEVEAGGHFGSRVIAGVSASDGGEDNSYSDPLGEWLVTPAAGLIYRDDWGEFKTEGGYTFYSGVEGDTFHTLKGALGLSFFLNSADISTRLGVLWDDGEGVLYPFTLKAEGMAGELFNYRIEGGYRTERSDYRTLWRSSPLLGAAQSLPLSHGWRGEGNIGGTVQDAWDWSVEGSFYAAKNYPMPKGLSEKYIEGEDPKNSGLVKMVTDDVNIAESGVTLGWNPNPLTRLSLSWEGEFLGEAVTPEGQHRVSAGVQLEDEEGIYGGSFNGAYRLNPTADLPIIGSEAFYRISEGIIARLEWTDMLGPLVGGGRKIWGDYIEPGMQLRVLMEISL
ncbi:MAG: hypothetical protein ACLFMZ_09590 [Spirochaetaceae bacterium]